MSREAVLGLREVILEGHSLNEQDGSAVDHHDVIIVEAGHYGVGTISTA